MHRIRCIAKGGFKINGPPRIGKGPMTNEEDLKSSNEASLPKPTQAGRIETCTELIKQAMKCLENNDRECVMKLIEELVRNQCHDGRLISKEVADRVRELVHELWSRDSDNYGLRCKLLMLFRSLDVSKSWIRNAMNMSTKTLNKWSIKCGIELKSKARRVNIVKRVEGLLRERFGWDEVKMCEELMRFIGIDVDEFRRHGIEPCSWLEGLESLRDLRRPYWFGLRVSDKHGTSLAPSGAG